MSGLLDLCAVRQLHGRGYVSIFPDGLIVPWKPLSVQEYLAYDQDTLAGVIPLAFLEDEIFKSCVLDPVIVGQVRFLKAGIVSTVVGHIWSFSGPTDSNAFHRDLEMARQMLYGGNSKAIHQLVELITMAFPYKPEEVYQMDYQILMLRAAQAETKLIQMGILQKPIELEGAPPQETLKPRIKVDAKQLWEEQHQSKPAASITPKKYDKWYKKSPVLEAKNKKKINFKKEQLEADAGLRGWDKADQHILANNMVEDAKIIYADLIKELEAKNKSR